MGLPYFSATGDCHLQRFEEHTNENNQMTKFIPITYTESFQYKCKGDSNKGPSCGLVSRTKP